MHPFFALFQYGFSNSVKLSSQITTISTKSGSPLILPIICKRFPALYWNGDKCVKLLLC